MSAEGLIDTGAILSLIDRDSKWHVPCRNAFREIRLPVLTSEAVLTEVFHLAERDFHNPEQVWGFVQSGAIRMGTIQDDELRRMQSLMKKYRDRPMDFADATLVYLAERESLSLILTIDHDDFETYRIAGTKRFTI